MQARDLIGRRFEMIPVGNAALVRALPDFTIISADPHTGIVRVHRTDGYAQRMELAAVIAGIQQGILIESEMGVPFVLNRPKEMA
jgi:hypothetical protein